MADTDIYTRTSGVVNRGPGYNPPQMTLKDLKLKYGADQRWEFSRGAAWNSYNDEVWDFSSEGKAPAPAPALTQAPSSGGGRIKSALTAPAPAPFQQTAPTQKERDEVTPPAKGLESTIKTSPKLLREKRRRSYLTS